VKILHDDNDDTYDDNGSASSAVLSASVSTRCGASAGWDGDIHQILRGAGNILNKQERTSDKGCPPVWWLGVLLTSQQFDSLLLYGIFHKASD
jgi:hypothetical protein